MQARNIYQRINAVMQEVSYVKKEEKMVNGQYRFVAHDAVVATLQKSLVQHGIVVVPTTEEIKQDGNRTTISLRVEFVNMDKPEDRFSVSYPGYGVDGSDKGPGKAISYAFKYALLKTFCLETGEQDPEYDVKSKYEPPVEAPKFDATDLRAKKKELINEIGKEETQNIIDFLTDLSKDKRKSVDEIVMQYTNAKDFKADFITWKSKV